MLVCDGKDREAANPLRKLKPSRQYVKAGFSLGACMRFFSWILILMAWAIAAPAWAELRDISWSPSGHDGQMLLTFVDQPTNAKVFVHAGWIDVDVLGVKEVAGQVDPAFSSDIVELERIPAPGGARFRIKLEQTPETAKVQVFKNAVLVSAIFPGKLRSIRRAPMQSVHVPQQIPKRESQSRKPEPALPPAHQQAAKPVAPKPLHEDKPGPAEKAGHDGQPVHDPVAESEEMQGHDGEAALPALKLPKKGVGMIREASTQMARGLSQQQCDKAENKVKADPWALDNLSRYGACLAREGKMKEAKEVFERLITFDPETVSAYLGLGALAQDAGELDKARDYYEEALSLGGSDAEAARVREMLASLQTETHKQADNAGHGHSGH